MATNTSNHTTKINTQPQYAYYCTIALLKQIANFFQLYHTNATFTYNTTPTNTSNTTPTNTTNTYTYPSEGWHESMLHMLLIRILILLILIRILIPLLIISILILQILIPKLPHYSTYDGPTFPHTFTLLTTHANDTVLYWTTNTNHRLGG